LAEGWKSARETNRQAFPGWWIEGAREREVFAMMKRILLVVGFFVALSCGSAAAQNLCPAGVVSDKLICLVPQVFGPNGFVLPAGVGGAALANSFAGNSLTPLNSAIGRQAVLVPQASPSSGIIYTWDPDAHVPVASTGSFGPIYGERAETIGKYKLFIGYDYQYLKFSSLDGIGLKTLPEVFTQPNDSVDVPGFTCSASPNGTNTGKCAFIRDVVKVNSRLDLKVHEFVSFINFGVTDRIDVSVAIPIANVRMGITSDATIVDVSNTGVHAFASRPDCGITSNCVNQTFSSSRTASGIGDMTLRVKGTAWKGDRAALALGADIRFPTGDAQNFLGAGAAGVKPFVIWSLSSRIAPHVIVGYEVNGSSVIAGNISIGSKERLPSQLTYAGGVDMRVTKWLTTAFDLVGQQVFEAQRLSATTFTELGACTQNVADPLNPVCPIGTGLNNVGNRDANLSQTSGTLNVSNISIGAKMRPFSNFLITGNSLIKVNKGGLRSGFVPLLGVSYTF
jgi:hypothetical protein